MWRAAFFVWRILREFITRHYIHICIYRFECNNFSSSDSFFLLVSFFPSPFFNFHVSSFVCICHSLSLSPALVNQRQVIVKICRQRNQKDPPILLSFKRLPLKRPWSHRLYTIAVIKWIAIFEVRRDRYTLAQRLYKRHCPRRRLINTNSPIKKWSIAYVSSYTVVYGYSA